MAGRLTVPSAVRAAARLAIRSARGNDIPELTYRIAGGWCYPDDRQAVAMWALDNPGQFEANRCTLAAALRGGRAGRDWALAAAGGQSDVERLLADAARSDQLLTAEVAGAVRTAWTRAIDHATRKARSRLDRNVRAMFDGFPDRDVALNAGLDDLLDKTWEAFAASVAAISSEYARTQGEIVSRIDEPTGKAIEEQVRDRSADAVAALVAFMNERARLYLLGDVPQPPQDLPAARAISAWVSGALPGPSGFAFVDLQALGRIIASRMSSAQEAIMALAAVRLERLLTWHHGFYGSPLQPFEPHVEADGGVYTPEQVLTLAIQPGDHPGCRCALVPHWRIA